MSEPGPMIPAPSSLKRKLFRAVALRCPRCGSRRTFLRGWFRHYDRCRTCGIRWRREEGFELGAVTINIIVTLFSLIVAMTVLLIATLPDVPVAAVVTGLSLGAIVIPIIVYPFTYTIWLAVDLAVHPPDQAELQAARQAGAMAYSVPIDIRSDVPDGD